MALLVLFSAWSSAAWSAPAAVVIWKTSGVCSPGSHVPQSWSDECQRIKQFDVLNFGPSLPQAERLSLQLPGFPEALVARRLKTTSDLDRGAFTWRGIIDGDTQSSVMLAVVGEAVSGRIMTSDGRHYRLRTSQDDGPIIERVDPRKFLPEQRPGLPPLLRIPQTNSRRDRPLPRVSGLPTFRPCNPPGGTKPTNCVRVLFVYTPRAMVANQNILADAYSATADTNESFANSGVWLEIEWAGARPVDYVEATLDCDLYWLAGEPVFTWENDPYRKHCDVAKLKQSNEHSTEKIRALRDELSADVVVLLSNHDTGPMGIRMTRGYDGPQFAPYAFAVVPQSHLNVPEGYSYNLAHELGHVLGAQHDAESAKGELLPPFDYSYGHIDPHPGTSSTKEPCEAWMTTMGQNGYCQNCKTRQLWSSADPKRTLKLGGCDRPTGSATADNARTLNETGPIVAAFR